jgi:hypothetical protein
MRDIVATIMHNDLIDTPVAALWHIASFANRLGHERHREIMLSTSYVPAENP